MPGGTDGHELVSGNFFAVLHSHRRADGWEPPEIVQGMVAEFTLRSVTLTLKVADLFAV